MNLAEEPTPAPEPQGAGRTLGGATLVVVAATMGSKLLGFARDAVLAARFGSTLATDAYLTAAQASLTLFAAVGVSITTVFIPLFAGLLTRRGRGEAEAFAANVNGVLTLIVGLLIVLLEVLAGPALRLYVADPTLRAAAVPLVRIMAPLILFYAWSGVVGGVLNVRGFFGPNAGMGIPQNLVIIAAIVLGTLGGRRDIALVAWGSLVGTFTTYLVQLPALRRSRFRVLWRVRLNDPLLLRMGRLAVPAALTALVQQVGLLSNFLFGSMLNRSGLISDLIYASRLQLLAYSVLGMSVATVLYPNLSRAAAAGDMGIFRATLMRGLGLVNFVTLPVSAGLLFLRLPAVHTVFQHGQFTAADSAETAWALLFLTLGTPAFGWQDYLNRGFFALQDTRTPMLGAVIAVAVTIMADLWLVHTRLALGGLALGMALGWAAAVVMLTIRLRARLGLVGGRQVVARGLRMALAATAAFAAARELVGPLVHLLGPQHDLSWAVALVAAGSVGSVLYGLACWLLRVSELQRAWSLVRGRLHALHARG